MIRYPLTITLLILCSLSAIPSLAEPPLLEYTVIATAPHNPKSFTQGWIKQGKTFYESSGHYGRSFVQKYSEHSSNTRYLEDRFFAEGLTLFNQQLYLLTWKENTLLVLDPETLETEKTLYYKGQGWGLTHNGKHLIMSNGSPHIFLRDANNFSIVNTITIPYVKNLNELEYTNGILWANDWSNDYIYAINLNKSCVLGRIDLGPLRKKTVRPSARNVTNGIAYDQTTNALWVTGKYWPKRYLISTPLLQTENQKAC